jgi:hypothetical protein
VLLHFCDFQLEKEEERDVKHDNFCEIQLQKSEETDVSIENV